MDFTVLYDSNNRIVSENGKTMFSKILYIPQGKVALVSLFNMVNALTLKEDEDTGKPVLTSDTCIKVHKISLGRAGSIVKKLSCGDPMPNLDAEIRAMMHNRRMMYEPVYQCGTAWTINPCNNFALIPTPGFYMLELFDVNQFDTAYIEYVLLDVAESLAIPDDFKLGSMK